jgi:hypothetical protein
MIQKATMIYANAEDGWSEVPCTVELGADSIHICYKEDGGKRAYLGKAIHLTGHYHLFSEGPIEGSATLHTEDFKTFEGSWTEDGYDGLWKIVIK